MVPELPPGHSWRPHSAALRRKEKVWDPFTPQNHHKSSHPVRSMRLKYHAWCFTANILYSSLRWRMLGKSVGKKWKYTARTPKKETAFVTEWLQVTLQLWLCAAVRAVVGACGPATLQSPLPSRNRFSNQAPKLQEPSLLMSVTKKWNTALCNLMEKLYLLWPVP